MFNSYKVVEDKIPEKAGCYFIIIKKILDKSIDIVTSRIHEYSGINMVVVSYKDLTCDPAISNELIKSYLAKNYFDVPIEINSSTTTIDVSSLLYDSKELLIRDLARTLCSRTIEKNARKTLVPGKENKQVSFPNIHDYLN